MEWYIKQAGKPKWASMASSIRHLDTQAILAVYDDYEVIVISEDEFLAATNDDYRFSSALHLKRMLDVE